MYVAGHSCVSVTGNGSRDWEESKGEGEGDKVSDRTNWVSRSIINPAGTSEVSRVNCVLEEVGGIIWEGDGEIVKECVNALGLDPIGRARVSQDFGKGKYIVDKNDFVSVRVKSSSDGLEKYPIGKPNPSSKFDGDLVSLFVGNLLFSVSSKWLFQKFKHFGSVKNVFILDKVSVSSKLRCGFVRFACMDSAISVVSAMDGFCAGHFYLQVQLAKFRKRKFFFSKVDADQRGMGSIPLIEQGTSNPGLPSMVGHTSYVQAVLSSSGGLKRELDGVGVLISSGIEILCCDPSVEEVRKVIVRNGVSFEVLCRQQASIEVKRGGIEQLYRCSRGLSPVEPIPFIQTIASCGRLVEDEGHFLEILRKDSWDFESKN